MLEQFPLVEAKDTEASHLTHISSASEMSAIQAKAVFTAPLKRTNESKPT
jgi:hypothetical protein